MEVKDQEKKSPAVVGSHTGDDDDDDDVEEERAGATPGPYPWSRAKTKVRAETIHVNDQGYNSDKASWHTRLCLKSIEK